MKRTSIALFIIALLLPISSFAKTKITRTHIIVEYKSPHLTYKYVCNRKTGEAQFFSITRLMKEVATLNKNNTVAKLEYKSIGRKWQISKKEDPQSYKDTEKIAKQFIKRNHIKHLLKRYVRRHSRH